MQHAGYRIQELKLAMLHRHEFELVIRDNEVAIARGRVFNGKMIVQREARG